MSSVDVTVDTPLAKLSHPVAHGSILSGSGSAYISGYCDANYRPDMTQAECEEFVRNAISLAISRDGSSGGVIRTCTINENGQEKKYTPGDKLPEFFNQ